MIHSRNDQTYLGDFLATIFFAAGFLTAFVFTMVLASNFFTPGLAFGTEAARFFAGVLGFGNEALVPPTAFFVAIFFAVVLAGAFWRADRVLSASAAFNSASNWPE